MWLRCEGGNRQAVESELNSIYMGDLFTGNPAELSCDEMLRVPELTGALVRDSPERAMNR